VKIIKIRNSTSIAFHRVKGHACLIGNESADYLAKSAARYNTTIAYNEIPISRGKQIMKDHYTKIWNAIHENCKCLPHKTIHTHHFSQTSPFPMAQLSSHLVPNKSWQCRSYLHIIKQSPYPNCNCPKKTLQPAHHLMLECSLLFKDRPSILKTLLPNSDSAVLHKYRQHHKLPQTIFQALQDDSQRN
jgi:hypothetical protein